jgi:hypothetical protein
MMRAMAATDHILMDEFVRRRLAAMAEQMPNQKTPSGISLYGHTWQDGHVLPLTAETDGDEEEDSA